ncbi:hypothetical protein [Oribacterium sinus]|jgi:hypothetical protein|uniref:hypothetical protein n=1 Tax=Oribacterium sinus TaxID=237576 RepID=UPI0028EC2C93|nr:hypothetical protein [Oribacterium sinus]
MDKKATFEDVINGPYFIDDSKMPSAEESKKIVIPKELEEKLDAELEEIAHKYGLY